MAELCKYCHRPLALCRIPVDQNWPQRAQEAYARAKLTHAYTCDIGQKLDLVATGGWCYSRARFDRGWSGPALTEAERRGLTSAPKARYAP